MKTIKYICVVLTICLIIIISNFKVFAKESEDFSYLCEYKVIDVVNEEFYFVKPKGVYYVNKELKSLSRVSENNLSGVSITQFYNDEMYFWYRNNNNLSLLHSKINGENKRLTLSFDKDVSPGGTFIVNDELYYLIYQNYDQLNDEFFPMGKIFRINLQTSAKELLYEGPVAAMHGVYNEKLYFDIGEVSIAAVDLKTKKVDLVLGEMPEKASAVSGERLECFFYRDKIVYGSGSSNLYFNMCSNINIFDMTTGIVTQVCKSNTGGMTFGIIDDKIYFTFTDSGREGFTLADGAQGMKNGIYKMNLNGSDLKLIYETENYDNITYTKKSPEKLQEIGGIQFLNGKIYSAKAFRKLGKDNESYGAQEIEVYSINYDGSNYDTLFTTYLLSEN